MLDSETRRKIDTLRDILVGKIPNPQTQVEQITTGLIYKFMDDMDKESLEMGGEGSFFVGDYEKYAWDNLLDPKLSGVEKVKLYSDAIEGMYLNPSAPQLFREMFRNAFLPFKDPSTLNMFLKEINEFHYSHSEKLGDAFEYLISIMGSQGDAGQFRTPRHIIDFIVDIIDPQKNETILDPACGTAGFLISSYKHILENNTDKKLGDQLSAEDKKRVGENITGYDISPEMVRLSLVNMYLHGFSTPKIDEYDTLSSEDKWNEYFDVILANPPFFSPKGGIQPHKRFGVDSKKAEVLFTSYILEHLKPNGRAGIIVPEGIIFQTGTAYKELRKQLVDKALVGVISLPAGVFNPYAGVKTSILILDKKLSKKKDLIFFADVKNDGFDLGSQRKQIKANDLPEVVNSFKEFILSNSKVHTIEKSEILSSNDIGLSKNRYLKIVRNENISYKKIGDVLDVFNGSTPSRKDKSYWEGGDIPWFTIDDIRNQGFCIKETTQKITSKALEETSVKLLPKHSVLLCCTASVGEVAFTEIKLTTNQQFNGLVVKDEYKNDIDPKYIYWCCTNLKKELIRNSGSTSFNFLSVTKLKEIEIPLPHLEVQQQIVDELEGYQKIIDGCKQIVENYIPFVDTNSDWDTVDFNESCKVITPTSKIQSNQFLKNGKFPIIDQAKNKIAGYWNNHEDVTEVSVPITMFGDHTRIVKYIETDFVAGADGTKLLSPNETLFLPKFFFYMIGSIEIPNLGYSRHFKELKEKQIPCPPLETQQEIVSKLDRQSELVDGNLELIETFSQKIQDRISKVWVE